MKRVAVAVLALSLLVPVSRAIAAPEPISDASAAILRADRVGNATQTAAPATPTTTAPPAPPTTDVSAEMQQVFDLANVERTSRGLAPLRFSAQLNTAALAHTQRQAAHGDIFHTDLDDGSNPGTRISRTGYEFSAWGENVAAGYRSAASVMQGWMTSPGHCRNLLNPEFTEIGVGYVTGGERYGEFWTQVFARPSGVARPAGTYDPAWC